MKTIYRLFSAHARPSVRSLADTITDLIHKVQPKPMNRQSIFDDIQAKMTGLLKDSPAADIERNVKEVMSQGFRKMDLVTREEFELQRELLQRTREKVEALEKQLALLSKG